MTIVTTASIRHGLQELYPRGEASWLVRIVCCEEMGLSEVDYYAGKDMVLSANDLARLEEILARLRRYEPIQYVQGRARFLGRWFHVEPGVLIPRPETEELVEKVLRCEGSRSGLRLLDVGTGSGCIAVSLALGLPGTEVCGWDVSDQALAVARRNAATLGAVVNLEHHDVLDGVPLSGERFDVIVSNPPYVRSCERASMEANVKDWEPSLALFVPDDDPLLYYRAIGRLGLEALSAGGRMYLEINSALGGELRSLLLEMGYGQVRIEKDLSGHDRFAIVEKR